ncbi:DExH-box splicing factor binding site-domain-containing protein [Irpex rosettiformis]|uniref:DExH-box splicing factor binding site-domain-containing protein n=1 Tax=Irpex rosettiformis TaxID=378272 RepID=A0ACB8U3H8_9APHY|nr:DExH-box splicing factor binding site-domain-containing protein [Irpex rosettiformis]
MSADEGKVSFTIRRPTPVSRASSTGGNDSDFKIPAIPARLTSSANSSAPGSPLHRESPKPRSRTYDERGSSSEDDEEEEDELVTGFDKFGVQRVHEKKKPQGPLVIPALKNKDWRELARKRKNIYVPPSAAVQTGADGSVGGLGTKDTINSGPQLSGLQQVRKKVKIEEDSEAMEVVEEVAAVEVTEATPKQEETEDQKAIRALIASAEHDDDNDVPRVDIIPAPSEEDAYRQDVEELPDSATLDDYERVPVSQFGAALLRGMGWKEGTAASRKGKGPVEPWLPQARPALLGIGAKEKEVFDDGSKGKKKNFVDKRYIPVIKQERREDSDRGSRSGSATSSRRRTPSPRRSSSRRSLSAERRKERDRYDSRDRERDRDRRSDRESGDKDRGKDKYGDRYGDRERKRDYDRREDDFGSRRDRDRRRETSPSREKSDRTHRDRDRR